MRSISRLPVWLALLLVASALSSCDDSLLPGPNEPGAPIDTVTPPENGHILFSRLDPTNFPFIVTSLEYTDSTGATPTVVDQSGLLTAKPGAQLMAFQSLPGFTTVDVYVSDHLGGNRQKLDLVFIDQDVIYASAAISPDGSKVAFATEDFNTGRIRLYYAPRNDNGFGAAVLIDDEFHYLSTPAWSRDGSKIAYFTQTFDDVLGELDEYGFAVADVAGQTITPIRVMNGQFTLESGETIDWSPIADEVIFSAETSLYLHKWGVQGAQQFTNWMHGAFSPDGKFVAVMDVARGQQLAVVDWSNKLATALDVPPLAQYPSWSPDGKYLIYTRSDLSLSESQLQLVEIADPANTRMLVSGFVGRGFWVKPAKM